MLNSNHAAYPRSSPESPDSGIPVPTQSTKQLEHDSTGSLPYQVAAIEDGQRLRKNMSLGRTPDHSIGAADVIYSYYPFIQPDAIHQLMIEDIQYLETLGCYRVPSRPSLDVFVKAYFRYIHPLLPILDEGNFWRAYSGTTSIQTSKISIFVFQAMLFAACSVCIYHTGGESPLLTSQFVPMSTIERLGFKNFHAARTTLYRRAKVSDTRSEPCGHG